MDTKHAWPHMAFYTHLRMSSHLSLSKLPTSHKSGKSQGDSKIGQTWRNIFRVTCHLCGEFTGPGEFPTQRPVTQMFDVFFDLRLNKWLSKQPWGWWFETPSWSLWRQCNESGKFQTKLKSGKSQGIFHWVQAITYHKGVIARVFSSRPVFTKKTSSYGYRDSHYKPETVVRPS